MHKAPRALPVPKDLKVTKALPGLKALRGIRARKGGRGIRATKAMLEQPVLRVRKGLQDLVLRVLRAIKGIRVTKERREAALP